MSRRLLKLMVIAFVSLTFGHAVWSQNHPTATLTVRSNGAAAASGSITIAFNSFSETVTYGQFSTPSSIASAFAAEFSSNPLSALPRLCTMGVCAKADGATITLQLEEPATFGALAVTSSNNPFLIDQSSWPTVAVAQVGVACLPAEITGGTATSCSASVPAGTTGYIIFSVDGSPWDTVAIDGNGNATTPDGLQNVGAGLHVVQASYTPLGAASISGIAIVNVLPNASISPSAPPGPVYSYSITDTNGNSGYAANGNVVAYSDSVNGTWGVNASGVGAPLGYDSLNRLVSATQTLPGGTAQYLCWSYDSFGNMKQYYSSAQAFSSLAGAPCQQASGAIVTETVMNYTDGNNHINSGGWRNGLGTFGQGTPRYDDVGNMTYDLQNQYLYNADGNVCAMQGPGGYGLSGSLVGYLYDAAGRRVAKGTMTSWSCDPTSNGFQATNVYVVGPGGEQMTEMTPNPSTGAMQWKNTNVYTAGQLVATYDVTPNGTQALHFQLADWEGTRRVQTDYAGNIEESCTSGVFGDVLSCTQTSLSTADDATEQHYTGKERDTESGLDYFGARYYASNMGRFMSPDWSAKQEPVPYSKLDNPQTLNLYNYMRNNPLAGVDADGHWPEWLNSVGRFAGSVGMGLAKFGANVLSFPGGDCSCQSRLAPPNAPSNGVERATMITAGIASIVVPVADAAFGGSATVSGTAPAALETQGATTTAVLTGLANDAVQNVGSGSGAVYGTAVHSEFSDLVEATGNSNLSTEVSYKGGQVVPYGTSGSVRADVVEGPMNAPTQIYDLKTGNATLTSTRVNQIQNNIPGGSNVPVTQIKPQP